MAVLIIELWLLLKYTIYYYIIINLVDNPLVFLYKNKYIYIFKGILGLFGLYIIIYFIKKFIF